MNLYRFLLLVVLLDLFGNHLNAQLPKTHIYACKIKNLYTEKWSLDQVQFISNDNLNGYNNQPFLVNGDEFYYVQRKPDDTNTDIYYCNLNLLTKSRITNSPGSEYSPRIYPNNKEIISAVYVPEFDSTIQNLIGIDKLTGIHSKVFLDKQGKVGYYRHLSEKKWLCFLVDDPHILTICEEESDTRNVFASSIGRTLEVIDSNRVLFVHKILDDNWLLKEYHISEGKAKVIAKMPQKIEDFVLLPNGDFLCAEGPKILKWDEDQQIWKPMIDFSEYNISNINRMSIKNNTLVFVNVLP